MVKHKAKRITRKEKAAAARKDAEATFLAYHEGSSWAHDKLRSGTAGLTPEAVAFMKDELGRRANAEERRQELIAQNDAYERAAKEAANAGL